MKEKKWRKCPFCKKEPQRRDFDFLITKDGEQVEKIIFFHFCGHGVDVSVRGVNREEIRQKWNGLTKNRKSNKLKKTIKEK